MAWCSLPVSSTPSLKALAQAKGVSRGKLSIKLSDQALGLVADAETAVISSPVTGFLKLKVGRPVTVEELKALDE